MSTPNPTDPVIAEHGVFGSAAELFGGEPVVTRYVFAEPVTVRPGEELAVEFHADGTATASVLPDADTPVVVG